MKPELESNSRKHLISELTRDEGRVLKPYRCTAGKLSIGIGRNIQDRGISVAEAEFMLSNDIDDCLTEAIDIFGTKFLTYDAARQRGVLNMIFNLGGHGFRGFIRTIDCIKREDWGLAADAILKSKWATQVGRRANRISEQFRAGGV